MDNAHIIEQRLGLTDARGDTLRVFDEASQDYSDYCRETVRCGGQLAKEDIAQLYALAKSIAEFARSVDARLGRLHVARSGAPTNALGLADLFTEMLDSTLEPKAYQVLSAAVKLHLT